MSESSTVPGETEHWLAVPEYEGAYEVSDLGRVRSIDRVVIRSDGKVKRFRGRTLRQYANAGTKGYFFVGLSRPGEKRRGNAAVHRLVLTAFTGPCPDGQEALHGPNGKTDNSLANLHWGTRKENFADRVRDGVANRGERHGLSKLTQAQVDEIRARAARGETQRSLARTFGVTFQNIHCIVRNKSWAETKTAPAPPGRGGRKDGSGGVASSAIRARPQESRPPRGQCEVAERWLPVPGFEGRYEVSDRGTVRSLDRVIKNIKTRRWPGKIIAPHLSWGGYPVVNLSDLGKPKGFFVHILVLTVFTGPCPEGHEALHGPGGRLDASLGNLHWGTRRENILDRVRDGTHNRGERHGMARLTQAQVDEIRRRWAAGETQRSLADEFGTTFGNVHSIVRGRTWSYDG